MSDNKMSLSSALTALAGMKNERRKFLENQDKYLVLLKTAEEFEALDLAIKELEKQLLSKIPCEMCGIEELPKDAGPHDFYVLDGCLWHCDSVFSWEGSKIRLCPNCGRKLEESE